MKMWSEVRGKGEQLLMLHPGGVDSRAFGPISPYLEEHYETHYVDRRAHGRTGDVDGPLHFSDMVDDCIEYIQNTFTSPINVLGFSDGAIVALLLTIRRPDLVKKVVCASGVYHYSGWQDGVLEDLSSAPDFMKQSYGEVSPDGVEHYDTVVAKLDSMHQNEPGLSEDDLSSIDTPCLVMVADDDEVKLEHAIKWYESMQNGELAVVPGTSHGMFAEKPKLFSDMVIEYFDTSPIQTFAPRRRR